MPTRSLRDQHIQPAARSYIIITPSGLKEEIHNLSKYCRTNNLNRSAMSNIICGRADTHKGYRIQPLDRLS